MTDKKHHDAEAHFRDDNPERHFREKHFSFSIRNPATFCL